MQNFKKKVNKMKLLHLGQGMKNQKTTEEHSDHLLMQNIEENVELVQIEFDQARKTFEENKQYRYWVFAISLFIGIVLGIELPKLYNTLFKSKYSRQSLDIFMNGKLGDYGFENITT